MTVPDLPLDPQERKLAINRSWYARNREKVRAQQARYRKENADAIRATELAYKQAHPDVGSEASRRYRARHPDRAREKDRRGGAKYRATDSFRTYNAERQRARRLGRDFDAVEYAALLRNDPCSYCAAPVDHVDHIVAVALGGENGWENLTGACITCNSSKRHTPLLVWLATRDVPLDTVDLPEWDEHKPEWREG